MKKRQGKDSRDKKNGVRGKRKGPKLLVNENDNTEIKTDWKTRKPGNPNQKGDPIEIQQEIEKEIERCTTPNWKLYEAVQLTENSVKLLGADLPTIEDILVRKRICYNTFSKMLKERNEEGGLKNEQLVKTYNVFKTLQQSILIKGGLKGVFNGAMTTLLLSANHGISAVQKVDIESNSTVNGKISVDIYKQLDEIHAKDLERIEQERAEMKQRKAELDLEDC